MTSLDGLYLYRCFPGCTVSTGLVSGPDRDMVYAKCWMPRDIFLSEGHKVTGEGPKALVFHELTYVLAREEGPNIIPPFEYSESSQYGINTFVVSALYRPAQEDE